MERTLSVVVVTGAGGFLGSAVVRSLVRAGAAFSDEAPVEHVVAAIRPGGTLTRLEELDGEAGWSIERTDVFDPDDLARLLAAVRPRAVINAALDHDSYTTVDEGRFAEQPLRTIVKWLRGVPGSRYLHAGSAWVLAGGDHLDENAPVAPASPYGENKARADALLAEVTDVSWINLRLFNMFGRYEDSGRLLPTLVDRLASGAPVELTHGRQVRDFNDVDTVARAFVAALAAPASADRRVYHIGSGRGTRVRDLAALVASFVSHDSELHFGSVPTEDETLQSLVANPQLARNVLGWEPDHDLAACVRNAVEWRLERIQTEVPA